MSERDAFLGSMMPRLMEAETAIHNGDAAPRLAMWSRNDPVSLFGAAFSATGWDGVSGIFKHLAEVMRDCESYEVELVAADAIGDLAYTVAYEHTSVTINDVPSTYSLRVTHIYRREDGEWKVVHRHGDRVGERPNSLLSGAPEGADPTR